MGGVAVLGSDLALQRDRGSNMIDKLEFDQVLAIVARSHFLSEIIGKRAYKRLEKELPDRDSTHTPAVIYKIRHLEDSILNIKSDKFLSFRIVSDDDGGSECGPWDVDVYGACGVWLVSSMDHDDLWFSDR